MKNLKLTTRRGQEVITFAFPINAAEMQLKYIVKRQPSLSNKMLIEGYTVEKAREFLYYKCEAMESRTSLENYFEYSERDHPSNQTAFKIFEAACRFAENKRFWATGNGNFAKIIENCLRQLDVAEELFPHFTVTQGLGVAFSVEVLREQYGRLLEESRKRVHKTDPQWRKKALSKVKQLNTAYIFELNRYYAG